jgi:SpoVK/Ycf46/Vps4 family AAA+-type ATPase
MPDATATPAKAGANLQVLVDAVVAVAPLLVARPGTPEHGEARRAWLAFEERLAADAASVPLARLVERCGLDSFELKCVVLALTRHVEPQMLSLVTYSSVDRTERTLGARLVVEKFCETPAERLRARHSFLPTGALLRHQLVHMTPRELDGDEGLLTQRYDLTTATLRYLLQEEDLSDEVAGVARVEFPQVDLLNVVLPADHLRQVRELVDQHTRYRESIASWGFDRILPYGRGLTLLFSGPPGTGKTLLAQAVATYAQRPLVVVSAADLPERAGIERALRDVFHEATLRDGIVLVDECEAVFGVDDPRRGTTLRLLETFEGIAVLVTNHPEKLDGSLERRIMYHVPFELPDPFLRRQIWEVHLPPGVPLAEDVDLDALAATYDFTGGAIKNAVLIAVNRALAEAPDRPVLTGALLEEGCRSQLRYALEELTVRTSTHLRLKDIALPEETTRRVAEVIAACRNQTIVLNQWGFGARLVTGKGITVLFDGPPGTGKTFCAEIIAGEIDRPLYRVNLPEVVSKWVGETEKHIKALFQQARISHAMLLFDEADSLFAARSVETKSATDRYANLEVNLLLQEIERFPGVCILTTNSFGALDKALVRRIQFRVTFEEPDASQRARIWHVLCPDAAPLAPDVDLDGLARTFDLTGGLIKNALLRAAYRACDLGSPITMAILRGACDDEYKAAGKVARDPSKRGPVPRDAPHRPVPARPRG